MQTNFNVSPTIVTTRSMTSDIANMKCIQNCSQKRVKRGCNLDSSSYNIALKKPLIQRLLVEVCAIGSYYHRFHPQN